MRTEESVITPFPRGASPEVLEKRLQFVRQRGCPGHALAFLWVLEAQESGVQGEPVRPAVIGRGELALQGAIVDALAADGRAGFAEMNADLVCPTALEPALDQGEVSKLLEHTYRGDRPLAAGSGLAAATAVAAVTNQLRLDALGTCVAAHDGEILAIHGVGAELGAEAALGIRRAREYNQAAGIAVEAVDRAEVSRPAIVEQGRQLVGERGGQESLGPGAKLRGLGSVAHGGDAGRLVRDNDVLVGVANQTAGECMPRAGRGLGADFDPVTGPYAATGVRACLAAHAHPASADKAPGYLRRESQS
jgi:hypothetical protein